MKSLIAILFLVASTNAFAQSSEHKTGLILEMLKNEPSWKQRQVDLELSMAELPERPVGSILQKDLDSIALCKMKLMSNARQYQITISNFDVRVSPDASNLFTVSGFGTTPVRSMTTIGADCVNGQLVDYSGRQ